MTKYNVAIDHGHGMETPGKETPIMPDIGRRIKEKEFNSGVALKLMSALTRCGIGYTDVAPGLTDIPLAQRSAKANTVKADILVSIHYNAFDGKFDTNKGGLCVFHYPGSIEGARLAKCIHKYLKLGTKQLDRGVLSQDFHMLRVPKMPSALSENGFMDDRFDASLMLSTDFQTEVAEEHCQGICEYLNMPYIKPVPKKIYRVQVGAFTIKANANALVNKLKTQGYNGYIVEG